ncbi:LysE family translocator [Aliagarivorans marinus]|uniref:LysE family translocator n=1 Tax=Aliagarivorans marinus TaxID=561965 RepID=UPI0003FCEFEF|nr:LysE family translocator [Aliagarivorans marinus]
MESLLALIVFAIVMTGTPGPNNVMLTYSGVNFGYWRSLPHMAGIPAGICSMLLLMGCGLGWVLQTYPQLHWGLKVLGSAYLLFLAWKMLAGAGAKAAGEQRAKPLRFSQSFAFQYLNPKAWMMASSAVVTFTQNGDGYWLSLMWVVLAFLMVNPFTNSCWVIFGKLIALSLKDARSKRLFNGAMSGLTAACVIMLWM